MLLGLDKMSSLWTVVVVMVKVGTVVHDKKSYD